MKFWFVGELLYKRVPDPESNEGVPIAICRDCRDYVHYCGRHEDRGSFQLFGQRIAHLEFVLAMTGLPDHSKTSHLFARYTQEKEPVFGK
jgi:hypothetical protein